MVVPSKDALEEKYDRQNKWPRDEDFKAEPEPRPRGDFIADHRGERRKNSNNENVFLAFGIWHFFFSPPARVRGARGFPIIKSTNSESCMIQ